MPAPPELAPDSGFAPWPPGPCAAAIPMPSARHAAAVEINNLLLIGKLLFQPPAAPVPPGAMTTDICRACSGTRDIAADRCACLNFRSQHRVIARGGTPAAKRTARGRPFRLHHRDLSGP